MSPLIRIGLIGPGSHATENLIPVILRVGGFRLEAISSRSLHKAQEYAARFGARIATDHWEELIDPTIVDAVVVSATPEVHAQVASLCLERGVHVFVEKPPAQDTDTLRNLVKSASVKPNAITFVDFNFRYAETYRKVVELVQSEAEIRCVIITFVSSKPNAPMWRLGSLPRSLLYSFGIHAVDMAVDLLGSVEHVAAHTCWIADNKLFLGMAITFAGGKSAFLRIGNYSNRFEYRMELVGSSGIVATLDQHDVISVYNAQSIPTWPRQFEGAQTTEYTWPSLRGGFAKTGYEGALKSFRDSILSGKPASSSLSSALVTYELMDEALSLIERRRATDKV